VTEIDRKADRLIVFTDHYKVSASQGRGWMVNVASYQQGVGQDAWTRADGFSEAVIAWIAASEETMH
jgi:60 kDa SS-A/Ro ribonucleoprotein